MYGPWSRSRVEAVMASIRNMCVTKTKQVLDITAVWRLSKKIAAALQNIHVYDLLAPETIIRVLFMKSVIKRTLYRACTKRKAFADQVYPGVGHTAYVLKLARVPCKLRLLPALRVASPKAETGFRFREPSRQRKRNGTMLCF